MRLILFYDAGQVRDFGEPFAWREDTGRPDSAAHAARAIRSRRPGCSSIPTRPGRHDARRRPAAAFKTSTGAEVRFFMPVLNVPFRLIFAYNPQRAGVLDNKLQPQKVFQFRFAVGTTF